LILKALEESRLDHPRPVTSPSSRSTSRRRLPAFHLPAAALPARTRVPLTKLALRGRSGSAQASGGFPSSAGQVFALKLPETPSVDPPWGLFSKRNALILALHISFSGRRPKKLHPTLRGAKRRHFVRVHEVQRFAQISAA
jgi:hypothetical protein